VFPVPPYTPLMTGAYSAIQWNTYVKPFDTPPLPHPSPPPFAGLIFVFPFRWTRVTKALETRLLGSRRPYFSKRPNRRIRLIFQTPYLHCVSTECCQIFKIGDYCNNRNKTISVLFKLVGNYFQAINVQDS